MTFSEFKDAGFIGLFLAFMIGPVFFMLLQTSIIKGFRAALSFDLGVILGDIVFILAAYYGSRSFLKEIKDDPRLFYVGGIILFVYGLIMFLNKKMKEGTNNQLVVTSKMNYLKLFAEGFLLNFINVGVLAFWLGLIIVIGPNLEMDRGKIFRFFGVIITSYLLVDMVKIILAKQLKSKLTPLLIFKIKRGMGIMLMIFGMVLFSKGFFPQDAFDVKTILEYRK